MIFANITWRIGAIIAAVLAGLFFIGLATQTIRIEGLRLWPLHITGFKEKNATLRLDLDTIKSAQEVARLKAAEAKARIEAEYRAKAEETDRDYQEQIAAANSRAADYARRMRVKAPRGSSSGTGSTAQGDSAQGPDRPGETAELGDYIAVSQRDFDILNENTQRLKAAHEWAKGLERP